MNKTKSGYGAALLAAALLVGGCSASIDTDIQGQWKGTDAAGHQITLQFSNEDVALTQDDRTLIGTWTLDSEKEPAELTLKMHTPSGHMQTVPMIAEMPSINRLRLRAGSNFKSRPIAFEEGAPNQILLKRMR